MLVAQDTTLYGEDLYGEARLPELLEELCKIDGLAWIRLLYCYPEHITDRLLDVMAAQEKILPYLDMPIQHCSGRVLKAMNRTGDAEWAPRPDRPHPPPGARHRAAHHRDDRLPRGGGDGI